MGSACRLECFCLDPEERSLFAGNLSGQILVFDIDTFEVRHEVQAHAGSLHAICAHPSLPYVAAIGNDRKVSLWRRSADVGLVPLSIASYRDIACSNDSEAIDPIFSHSVALAFHDREQRLVMRTGNGGTMELDFDDDGALTLRWALRLHGDWDVQMVRFEQGGDRVLSAGRDASLVLVDGGIEVRRWQFGDVVAHWAEHELGTTYLVASDLGLVARVDIDSSAPPVLGPRFAHDDMEFLTYNKTSGRVFCTSFDRNVYELDRETLAAKGVVFEPGYKCIWAKSLERDPNILLVLSRDGTLFKYNLAQRVTTGRYRDAPPALWSAVVREDGSVLACGEGADISHFRVTGLDREARAQIFVRSAITTEMSPDSYSKRMLRDARTGRLAFGRTDGTLWTGTETDIACVANMGSSIRDIAYDERRDRLYAATEDGRIVRIDWSGRDSQTVFQDVAQPFSRAVWALAYNPVADQLAFARFGKTLDVVSASDFSPVAEVECDRVKRIRWLDEDRLLFGSSDAVVLVDVAQRTRRDVVTQMQNTVEDFIWDRQRAYILAICYQCTIGLFDLATGERLDHVRDQLDYSKGIAWLDPAATSGYGHDFITWGRSGTCHSYRLHNERIIATGRLDATVGQSNVSARHISSHLRALEDA